MNKTIKLDIIGMSCNGCAAAIGRAVSRLDGVKETEVDYPKELATITFDENLLSKEKLIETIENLGYGVKKES